MLDDPGFARLLVGDHSDQTEVDLGSDSRLFPAEERLGLRVLSGGELTVDKLFALSGRAEARDCVDLPAVAYRYGLDRLLDLTGEKDRGFDARVFVEMLTGVDRLPRAAFALDDVRFEGLQAGISAWNERALDHACEHERIRDARHDRGPDLGLGR